MIDALQEWMKAYLGEISQVRSIQNSHVPIYSLPTSLLLKLSPCIESSLQTTTGAL